jgi:hypothetical protein
LQHPEQWSGRYAARLSVPEILYIIKNYLDDALACLQLDKRAVNLRGCGCAGFEAGFVERYRQCPGGDCARPVNFDRFTGTSPRSPFLGAKKGGTNGVKRKRRSGSGRSQSRSATTLGCAHSLSHGNSGSLQVNAKGERLGAPGKCPASAHRNSKDFVIPPILTTCNAGESVPECALDAPRSLRRSDDAARQSCCA